MTRRVLMTLDAVGGVWRYALDAARALKEEGTETVLVGQGPSPSADQRAEARRAEADLVWLDEPLDWTAGSEAELQPLARRLSALAASRGIDLLHLNTPSQAVGLAVDAPVVVMSHSCVVTWWRAVRADALPDAWAWKRRRQAAGLAAAQAVLVPSRSHGAALRQAYGPVAGLRVIHNASARSGDAVAKEPFVLAAGRWWDAGKNGRVLDAAAPGIAWPVVMAGAAEGPGGEALTLPNVDAPGGIGASAMAGLMDRAGLFVSPSLYEPFGLAVLEAAQAGCALVLADIPVFRELWDGAAVFFDPRDAAGLALAVNAVAGDAPVRQGLSERARERAGRFTPARQARALLAAYADAATAKARAGRPLAAGVA